MDRSVYIIFCLLCFWTRALANQSHTRFKQAIRQELKRELRSDSTEQNLREIRSEISELHRAGIGRKDPLPLYTKWSPWSRCDDCLQRRMRKCISTKCKNSKMYEERPCPKPRCKRKRRGQFDDDFKVVHLDDDMRKAGMVHDRMWGKWSKWSKCDKKCKTFRYRICKNPEKCKRRKGQRQKAYCYHDYTKCEKDVLSMIERNNRRRGTNEYNTNSQIQLPEKQHNSKPKQCGRPRRKSKMFKIIGGKEAKRYKWPWHVALINKYREVFCAGTLIAPRWVLTAGHCIRNYLRVRLNEHDLSRIDGKEIEMTVQKMFLHPRFNYQTVDNDIALLRLPSPVNLPPACLPTSPPKPSHLCSIVGWGKVNSSDMYGSMVLHEAKIPVVDWEECVMSSTRRYILTYNMFCAGWKSGKVDTCAGDSGGGFMCPSKEGSKPKTYSILGITSFGDGCGRRNKYGFYTMVYNYLKWINYITDTYS